MHPVYFVLGSLNLREVPDLARLQGLDESESRDLYARIYEALAPAAYPVGATRNEVLDPFKYVASASMRGESGCASPTCRFNKLNLLNRFGALYATSIVVPLGMTSPEYEITKFAVRTTLEYVCFFLLASRELIASGYFIPTLMRTTHHCAHEAEFVSEGRDLLYKVIEESLPTFAKDFRVRYQKPDMSPSGLPSIYIDGPEEFLDHGSIVYRQLDGVEPRLSRRRSFNAEGITEIKGKDKFPFLWPIFDQIGVDTSFYLAFRMHNSARLMTDRAGEAMLLEDLDDSETFRSSTEGFQVLTHALPLLSTLPIDRLLAIRAENRDSFEAYRNSVSEMTKRALKEGLSVGAATEYVGSELLPALEKITRDVASEQKKQKRRVKTGIGSIAAGLAMGALAAVPHLAIPAAAAAAVGSLVGGNLVKKASESACEHDAEIQRQHDLYFLMKVLNEEK